LKKYLFIIRAYNDIDHFTPIIDHILENGLARVYLYSSVSLKLIFPNENLEYLKKEYGLEPNYLLKPDGESLIKLIEDIYVSLVLFNTKSLCPKFIGFFLNHSIKRLRFLLRFFQERNLQNRLESIYDEIKPDLVVYDWQNPNVFPYSILTKKAKDSSVPVISIPHGLYIYTSVESTWGGNTKYKEREQLNIASNMTWDWFVVQNVIKEKQAIDIGIKKDTIVKMGSVRYEYQWIKKQKKIFTNNKLFLEGSGKKIVIFPSKLMYQGILDAYKEIIEETCKISDLVVLKPHTRHMRLHSLRSTINKSGIKVINQEFSSTELIDWCDIGIVWGSSIGIQLVLQNKLLFYPKYAHDLETIYDKYLPETVVNNTGELIEGIKTPIKNNEYNYSNKSKNKFIEEVIYGGDVDQSPLQKYTQFFDKIARGT
jgi:hypothetical protein